MPLDDDNSQLKQGKQSERQFLEAYSPWIEPNNGETSQASNWSAPDFKVRGTDDLLELKSDFYERPVNMYLERWTTERPDDDAGPWKSLKQGAEVFAYWYVSTGRIYIFRTKDLVKHVEELPAAKRREVKSHPSLNNGYRSVGILVKITDVDYIALSVERLKFKTH